MKQYPKISVLMAAYNEEKYIQEAIQSIIEQTYQNWEVVVVDDNSQDRTQELLQQFMQNNPDKIHIHRNDKNMGLAASLNIGTKHCTGKYIARMDADDICKPYRFLKQIEILESHPEIALVSGAIEYIDDDGNVFGRTYPITLPKKIQKKINGCGNIIVHPAVMMRKDVLVGCGGYCEGLFTGQDRHLWMKFLRKGYQLAMLPEPMISYRVSGKAISNQMKSKEQNRLMKDIITYDDPPRELLEALRREADKNKVQGLSPNLRRKRKENSMHCKIYRICKAIGLSDEIVEKTVCRVQNIFF